MSAFLDDLAKSLAQPISRRRALGLIGRALLAGALPAVLRPRPAQADSCAKGCTSNPNLVVCRNAAPPICSFQCCAPGDLCCTANHGAVCCPANCYTCGKVTVGQEEYPVCVPDPGGTVACPGFGQVPSFCCKTGESCCGDRCCQAGYECCPDPVTGAKNCCPPTRTCQNGKCVCKNGSRSCKKRKRKCCKGEKCCGKKLCCSTDETCCGKSQCCAAGETCCGGLLCCRVGEVCVNGDVPECVPSPSLAA